MTADPGRSDIGRLVVGPISAFPAGRFTITDIGGAEIGIFPDEDGSIHAIRNYCPHRGAPVCLGTVRGTMLPSDPGVIEYGKSSRVVCCPWHGYEFDLASGAPLFGAIRGRLQVFEAGVDAGNVWIRFRKRRIRGT